jgi:hypothetical protein
VASLDNPGLLIVKWRFGVCHAMHRSDARGRVKRMQRLVIESLRPERVGLWFF